MVRFTFSRIEIKEIAISAIVLSLAFALAYSDGIFGLNPATLPILVVFSFIAVGIGFLAHELIGHKLVAQHYHLHAEYRMWPLGLGIAIVSSLVGFVFAAPGAVYIAGRADLWGQTQAVSKKTFGIVSLTGPVVNIILAGAFLGLAMIAPVTVGGISVFALAVFVNVWLAIFNLLPVPPLDGSKIFAWDKRVWSGTMAVAVVFFLALTTGVV